MTRRANLALFAYVMIAATLAGQVLCSAQDVTLSDGLIGYWKFENSSGATVPDFSGHGNDGVIVPASAASLVQRIGAFAGALSFAGDSGHFVRIPSTPTLNSLKKQITVVALLYPTALWKPPGRPTLFSRAVSKLRRMWNGTISYIQQSTGMMSLRESSAPAPTGFAAIVQRQWRTTLHPDQFFLGYGLKNKTLHYKWHIGLMDGNSLSLYCLPKGKEQPQAAQWVQLAGTYDGVSGRMSLYINGELIGSLTHPGEIRLDAESLSRPITIGSELNGPSIEQGSGEFSGYIRGVRIYNRALSDTEIRLLAGEQANIRSAQ
jgi:hypothetical protein